jgi:hypothetical protein
MDSELEVITMMKLLGITLAGTCLLCWVLTSQSFTGPLMDLLLFSGGTLAIALFGMAAIEELDP